jgi:hypothetical protein
MSFSVIDLKLKMNGSLHFGGNCVLHASEEILCRVLFFVEELCSINFLRRIQLNVNLT